MANYAELKADIAAAIYPNETQDIDAVALRDTLDAMVDALGDGYLFKGAAALDTDPGTPDTNVFYVASAPGTYTNFDNLTVSAGEVAFFCYDGTWSKVPSGALSTSAIADNLTTNDATKVLSAKQGKALKDALDEVIDLGDGALAIVPTVHSNVANRYIETTGANIGTWRSITGGACRLYNVAGLEKVIIQANENYEARYALLKSDTITLSSLADFAAGETINTLSSGSRTTKSIPNDAVYLYVFDYTSSATYLPEKILCPFDNIESLINWVIKPTVDLLNSLVGMFKYTPTVRMPNDGTYIEPTGTDKGKWKSAADVKTIFIPLEDVARVRLVANSSYQCRYAFLQSDDVEIGSIADFANGTTIVAVAASQSVELQVPEDANYLYIFLGNNYNTNYEPAEITFTPKQVYEVIKNDFFEPLDARVTALEEGAGGAEKTTLLAETDLTIPNFHISVDDCISCFHDLVANNRASIYDNPFFAQMKSLHDTYGVKITLYCFLHYEGAGYDDFYLSSMPNTWKDEFQAAKGWLRFAFHGIDDLTFGSINVLPYYNEFVSAIYGMTEDYGCIDTVVRTQSFTGSLDNVKRLLATPHGAIAFLGGWEEGGRVSYYLDQSASDFLVRHGVKVDNTNGVLIFRSWPYLDDHTLADEQAEYVKYPCARKYVEIAFHLTPSHSSVPPGMYGRAEDVCDWFMNTKGYESHFLSDILR